MSLRLKMLQVARLAQTPLREVATLIENFIYSQLHKNGGFCDRKGESDLYYTVFGLESLQALSLSMPKNIEEYLVRFGHGQFLDFVHLCCLARCWGILGTKPENYKQILSHIEKYRTSDGGYNTVAASATGNIYGCFLALGAYQDLGEEIPQSENVLECIFSLKAQDGSFGNCPNLPMGTTPTTVAAIVVLKELRQKVDFALGTWLLRCFHHGGFVASPLTPVPDLLSTATVLHALALMNTPIDAIKEPCLDFIDTLWTNKGAFYGNWHDDILDCEYTYYGLLALGHLSV